MDATPLNTVLVVVLVLEELRSKAYGIVFIARGDAQIREGEAPAEPPSSISNLPPLGSAGASPSRRITQAVSNHSATVVRRFSGDCIDLK
jgi:hypothetical protein